MSIDRFQELVRAERGRALWEARRADTPPDALQARFVAHAFRTVPAYAGREPSSLVTRDDLRREGARFWSTAHEPGELVVARTSGTTGVPVAVARDPASFYGFAYDTYTVVYETVPELAPPAPGACAVLVLNDNPHRTPLEQVHPALSFSRIRRLILGTDEREDSNTLRSAARERPQLLYGRPRSLLRLARAAERTGERLVPQAVLSSGDNLHPDERARIQAVFQAPVYNAYASLECGFVAMECSAHGGLHVLPGRAVVEVLPGGGGAPSPTGAGELVVTALENWAMPMVRYRTGDHATVAAGRCTCGFEGATLTHLAGRDSTSFAIGGTRVNPSVLNPVFEALPIRQFQVRQEPDESLLVRWVPDGAPQGATTSALLEAGIRAAVGPVRLSVVMVDTLGRPEEKVQRYVRVPAG